MIAQSEASCGVTGDRDCLVIGCRSTRYFDAFPASSKDAVETAKGINDFKGTTKVQELYTDNSGELCKAANKLGIPHPTSTPGRPQTKGVAERLVRKVRGHSLCIVASGWFGLVVWSSDWPNHCGKA